MTPPKPTTCPQCARALRLINDRFPIHATDPADSAPYVRCGASLRTLKEAEPIE